MDLRMRCYGGEEDFWRIRDFLRRVFRKDAGTERSWSVARLDYWRWHVAACCGMREPMEEIVKIWETRGGEIAAVLNPESMGEAFLQVDPDHRSLELETEMIVVAEETLRSKSADGRSRLTFYVREGDDLRDSILSSRGYWHNGFRESCYSTSLQFPAEHVEVPAGWTIDLQRPEDVPGRSWASWKAFHPDEPDDQYDGYDWYGNIERMPLYRRDLDLVAKDSKGEIGAFCTVWYDDVTRTGYIEPVGRKPEVMVRGLTRSLMLEALRRLRKVGGSLATVGGSSFPARILYSSVMGSAKHHVQGRSKHFS